MNKVSATISGLCLIIMCNNDEVQNNKEKLENMRGRTMRGVEGGEKETNTKMNEEGWGRRRKRTVKMMTNLHGVQPREQSLHTR